MSRQHQSSLLPAERQGEAGYETTTKPRYLVLTDSVFHTVDIHISDAKIALRNSLSGRRQGGGGFHGLRIR